MVLTAIAATILLSSASALAAEGEVSSSAKEFLQGEAGLAGLRLASSATAAKLEAVNVIVTVAEAQVSLPFSANQMKTINQLIRLNINIYPKVGWKLGRLTARNQNLRDPGAWPSTSVVLHLKKGVLQREEMAARAARPSFHRSPDCATCLRRNCISARL